MALALSSAWEVAVTSRPTPHSFRSEFNGYLLEVYESEAGWQISKRLPISKKKQVEKELWARGLLAKVGQDIAPPARVFEEGQEIIVTMPYILRVSQTIDGADILTIRELGSTLARIHAGIAGDLSSERQDEWSTKISRTISKAIEVLDLRPISRTLLDHRLAEAATVAGVTLIHRDLRDDNIIAAQDSKISLIDWETSTIGHPDQDLVRLRESFRLDRWLLFSEAYRDKYASLANWSSSRWDPESLSIHRLTHAAELFLFLPDDPENAHLRSRLSAEIERLTRQLDDQ